MIRPLLTVWSPWPICWLHPTRTQKLWGFTVAHCKSPEKTRAAKDEEAELLSSLAQVDLNLARYDEAIIHLQEAAQIQRALADQSALATTLSTLGSVYVAEGKYQQAITNYENSLVIRQKAFGTHSAVTANSATDLAGVYYHMGQYSKAQTYYENALAALEATLGNDQAEVSQLRL